ncbi:MAG: MATE family efflux transporter [Woeseiaceae bacterium]|nr:MATE family efflux transporter [Woeseiaceae bacterium]
MKQPAQSLPGNRDVWRIALPMILSNVTVPLLGMVDTGVTGHLDSEIYLAAVAIGATIFSVLYTGVNFLRMGTTGLAAQACGASDYTGLRTTLGQAVIVALSIAGFLVLVHRPLGTLAVGIIGDDPAINALARDYFNVRVWSAPGTLVNYALIGWFLGAQNARVPFLIFLTINLTNIVLDLVFVVGLGMQVKGVALASVIAEYAGAAVGGAFVVGMLRAHPGEWLAGKLSRPGEYAAFFSVNANLFVRTMALMFTLTFITAQGARMGGTILAANALLMNLQNLTAFALDGIAHAAEALVGKAIGARRRDALEASVRLTLRWSLGFAVALALLYVVLGPVLVRVLTDLEDIRTTAMRYLPWLIASPLISVWSFLYDGVYVGATRAKEMRNIMIASAVVFLATWYVSTPLGNDGLWLSFLVFLAARGIGMHVYYRRAVLPAIATA